MTSFLPPPDIPTPKAAIRDAAFGSPDARWVAASTLGQVSGEQQSDAVAALEALLEDEIGEIRAQALEGITEQARQGFPVDTSYFIRALDDPSPAVRCTAVDSSLVVLEDPYLHLAKRVEDPDPSVRIAAAAALGETLDKRAVPALTPLLSDPEPTVRFEAAVSLANLKDGGGEMLLLDMASRHTDDAYDAAKALGHLKTPRAVPTLQSLASRFFGPAELKAIAKVALYRCSNGEKGKDLIRQGLRARSTDTRLSTLTALSRLPIPGLAEEVGRLIDDRNEMVVSSAIHTLCTLSEVDPKARFVLESCRPRLSTDLLRELDESLSAL